MQRWNGKWGEPDHHEHTTRLGGFFVACQSKMITDSRGLYDFSETKRGENPLKP